MASMEETWGSWTSKLEVPEASAQVTQHNLNIYTVNSIQYAIYLVVWETPTSDQIPADFTRTHHRRREKWQIRLKQAYTGRKLFKTDFCTAWARDILGMACLYSSRWHDVTHLSPIICSAWFRNQFWIITKLEWVLRLTSQFLKYELICLNAPCVTHQTTCDAMRQKTTRNEHHHPAYLNVESLPLFALPLCCSQTEHLSHISNIDLEFQILLTIL